MVYTVTCNGDSRTLADWRITTLQRRRSSMAADSVTFLVDGLDITGEAPFPDGSEISIEADGVGWFRGRVVSVRRSAAGNSGVFAYEVAGPWWYLERVVYQQPWAQQGSADVLRTHCLLNLTTTGLAWSTRDQIDDALVWTRDRAIGQYGSAPFQWLKSELPEIQIPSDEVRDTTAAEVIRKQFRWMPDCVTWFDYATTPPTFHARRRADLESVRVTYAAERVAVDLTPRTDLVVPSVVLKYEQVASVDGQSIASVSVDAWPPGATGEEFGALLLTVDLAGGTAVHASAYVRSEALPTTNEEWRAWLRTKEPWLNDARATILSIDSVTRGASEDPEGSEPIDPLPRELLGGAIADWMNGSSQQETVTIRVTLQIKDDAGEVIDDQSKTFTVNIQTTDVATGHYQTLQEFVSGESVPVGLAQSLYESLSVADYQGTISVVGDGAGAGVRPGNRLSIDGGHADWSTMAAPVQEVIEDVGSLTTRISVGPPGHLGPRDLIDLLRVNRFRLVITRRDGRSSGVASTGFALPKSTRLENASAGNVTRSRLVIRSNGAIDLDGALCLGKTVTVREVSVCVNGVEKRMLVLCSEPYDA